MKKEVQKIIEKLRPSLQVDGGDVELVEVNEKTGVVKVKLVGACAHCPMSQLTLKAGIEAELKKEVKGLKQVVAV